MTDYKQLCAELLDWTRLLIEIPDPPVTRCTDDLRDLLARTRAALAKPEPERLTVQEISDLPQHGENYIAEYRDGEIQLDGYFSRADLQQLADSVPSTHD